jgi:hypothetical protein
MCKSIKFAHFQNNKRDQAAVGPLEVPSPKKAKPEMEVAEKASVFYCYQIDFRELSL